MVEMPGGAIGVASDHAGFDLTQTVRRDLQKADHDRHDLDIDLLGLSTRPQLAGRIAKCSKGAMP